LEVGVAPRMRFPESRRCWSETNGDQDAAKLSSPLPYMARRCRLLIARLHHHMASKFQVHSSPRVSCPIYREKEHLATEYQNGKFLTSRSHVLWKTTGKGYPLAAVSSPWTRQRDQNIKTRVSKYIMQLSFELSSG